MRLIDADSLEEAQEPKHGKWVERGENDDGTHNIQCSACEAGYKSKGHANSIYTKQRFHFCPNCGADMRGEERRMRLIDADSLLRLVEIRKKWHGDLDVDEVEDMIKDAPTVCAIDCRKLDNQHNM